MESYNILPVAGLPTDQQLQTLRANCFGSLYYFIKFGLRRKKLTDSLHLPVCKYLERDHIKDVIEMPRDHYKSTIASEGYPIWSALPFGPRDEDFFKKQGYTDEYVKYMRRRHDQDTRMLLVSENITNAAKLGSRIRWHFESNSLYRTLFPESLPTSSEIWTNYSLHVRRKRSTTGGAHGEGTFDFIGVGSALQSRHYTGGIIQDDLVGRKAIESPSIMEKTIEYHQLVPAAMQHDDSAHEGNELVIGNRWGYHDLNSYIAEHESYFRFMTHSALGGCCPLHPPDQPIFPEAFNFDKLMRLKQRFGTYLFSCQYLNNPTAPEDADFKAEWLGNYTLVNAPTGETWLVHDVKDGCVFKDIKVSHLTITMAVDPSHSGNAGAGRCRHAIVVVGCYSFMNRGQQVTNYYLLDSWAQACNYDTFYGQIYKMAQKWRVKRVGFENVAAQKFAVHHIESMNKNAVWPIKIEPLKGEVEAPDGTLSRKKEFRIRTVLSPIFETQRFYVQKKHQDFIGEYTTFPRGRFVDQLDALAYTPQLLRHAVPAEQHLMMVRANQERAKLVGRAYAVN